MNKTIISNNTNCGDIIVENLSIEETIINGNTYNGKNIKISNNKIFINNKLAESLKYLEKEE